MLYVSFYSNNPSSISIIDTLLVRSMSKRGFSFALLSFECMSELSLHLGEGSMIAPPKYLGRRYLEEKCF